MKKNDIIQLNIESVTLEGSGVGYYEGMAVFVPFTAVGDSLTVRIVKVQKNYAFGIIDSVIAPSPFRVAPDCPAFTKCGGCDFRHMDYAAECRLKEEAVRQVLRRIGGVEEPPVEPIVGGDRLDFFRNKAQYPALLSQDGKVTFGFYAKRSHRVIPIKGCRLQNPLFDTALDVVSQWATENKLSVYNEATGKGLLRHIFLRIAEKTGEMMVMPVVNGKVPPSAEDLVPMLQKALPDNFHTLCFNINRKDTNVILGERCETIFGDGFITDILCGVKLRISPLAFSQTNRNMAEALYLKAGKLIPEGNKVLVDLYCGVGGIGLSMAHKTQRLIGVEIVPQAVEDAKLNAQINGIENAEFICADAAEAAKQLKSRGIRAESVILDPPRKGCEEEVLRIVAEDFAPENLVYISCNPGTLARDVKILDGLGYELVSATPYDLFPRTSHCETACLLKRK